MGRRLLVSPTECLMSDELSIQLEDLNQYEIVELEAEMIDNFGERWTSSVMVQANVFGDVDLAKRAPILGSYSMPCAMGLFWSMKRDHNHIVGKKTPLQPLKTNISLKRNGAVEEVVQVVRHLVHPSLVREPVRNDDLIGTFFHHGDHRKRPTILVLGGSEGGLREAQAALLAAQGFNTLATAYFGMEGLPSQLINIPLEYFQKALCYLGQHPTVDSNRIGIVGTSKGGELALLLASIEPKIRAVAAYVPSSVIHRGLGDTSNGAPPSSWSYMGDPLTFAYKYESVKELTQKLINQRNACGVVSYREWYRVHADAAADSAKISVETINGPILIITGQDDQLWPSDYFGSQMMERLKTNRFGYQYEHLCYPKAGHAIGYPGMPTTETTEFKFGSFALKAGGTPEDNFKAQTHCWNKLISFFQQSL